MRANILEGCGTNSKASNGDCVYILFPGDVRSISKLDAERLVAVRRGRTQRRIEDLVTATILLARWARKEQVAAPSVELDRIGFRRSAHRDRAEP